MNPFCQDRLTESQSMRLGVFVGVFLGAAACLVELGVTQEQAEDRGLEKTTRLGPVVATLSLSPEKPVIGDLLRLTLRVVAQEGVELLMPEFGEAVSRFQVVDFSPKESINQQGEAVFTQVYKLQSPPSGSHAIPPILIEFVDQRPGEESAPEGMDAYELFTERINFEVQSVVVENVTAGLNPPLGRLEPRQSEGAKPVSLQGYAIFVVLALVTLGILGWMIVRYKSRVIKKTAYEIARRQLNRLVNQPLVDGETIGVFYVEITTVIRKYLENRFELKAPELTTEEFLSRVGSSAELTNDHKRLLNEFLKHADLVKFAGMTPTEDDIRGMIEKATRFLEETRDNSPLLVDPDSSRPDNIRRSPNPKEPIHV
jgi:hypothetical protein